MRNRKEILVSSTVQDKDIAHFTEQETLQALKQAGISLDPTHQEVPTSISPRIKKLLLHLENIVNSDIINILKANHNDEKTINTNRSYRAYIKRILQELKQ